MLSTLPTSNPFQLAHKPLRRDPEIVAGLNAVQKAVSRTVPDIVLLICLERFAPEMELTRKTWPAVAERREELSKLVYERLHAEKETNGTPITHAIVQAVTDWLQRNVAGRGQFGAAIWRDDPQAQPTRPEGMTRAAWGELQHVYELYMARAEGEITTNEALDELLEYHRLRDRIREQLEAEGQDDDLTPRGWPC